jgi:sigma-E factor negative regulatory protein RseC
MIEQQARVISVESDHVWVSVTHQSGCHACELKQGCGTGSLGKLLGRRASTFKLPKSNQLKLGDRVVLGIPDHSYLLASGLIYLIPLLSFFVFAGIAELLLESDLLVMLAAVTGLGVGLALAKRFAHRKYAHLLQPKILRQIW